MSQPHVVILGAGFGGLSAAKALARAPVRVTVVDQSNHHLFQPLLYQVATAALTAPDIAAPIRGLLADQANCTVLMAQASRIDVASRVVTLDQGELRYDALVVATGMTHAYFGHDEWAKDAPGLKTLQEALDIRARVLRAYEAAERESDHERQRELLTFVVIGAGPTGVEMAGALAEIATRTLARDFRRFDPARDVRVVLIEGGDRVLPAMDPESSSTAQEALRGLGVEVRLRSRVTALDARGVSIGGGRIEAATIVWAAGLRASPLTADLGCELDRAGRVRVTDELGVPGHPEVFVIGDLIGKEQDGKPLPGVAQLAMQSGRYAARAIESRLLGYPVAPFRYADKGSMATIGRAQAVAEVFGSRFGGVVAWVLWLFIHILFLVDFRNRIAVLMEWAYAYVTWRRSARVILDAPGRHRPAHERQSILRTALSEPPQEPARSVSPEAPSEAREP